MAEWKEMRNKINGAANEEGGKEERIQQRLLVPESVVFRLL